MSDDERIQHARDHADYFKDVIPHMQVAVYVMAGGGMLGRSAAEQPGSFYVDARVSRRPYSERKLFLATRILAAIAEANGLDPEHMPEMPNIHNLGVF